MLELEVDLENNVLEFHGMRVLLHLYKKSQPLKDTHGQHTGNKETNSSSIMKAYEAEEF
jgi:hypothetical protein